MKLQCINGLKGPKAISSGTPTWVRGRFSDPLGLETFNNKGTVLLLERSANLTKEPSLCLNNNIIPGTKIYDAPDVAVGSTEFTYLMQQLYSLYNTGMTFQMVDFPSYKYNCHGYAWHVYQGGSYEWVRGRFSDPLYLFYK